MSGTVLRAPLELGGLPRYFREIRKFPMLKPSEEFTLAK
ncbi:RNA polymerase factor sigma-32, partial [Escherichia coli]|nr:RNA polymerase factor sigma-32 [Escherichia coli]